MEEDSREMESRVAEPMSPSLIPPAEVDLPRTANHPRTPSLSGRPATSSMTFLIAPCNLASTETGISTHTHTHAFPYKLPPLVFSSLLLYPPSPLSFTFSAISHLSQSAGVKLIIAKKKPVGTGAVGEVINVASLT